MPGFELKLLSAQGLLDPPVQEALQGFGRRPDSFLVATYKGVGLLKEEEVREPRLYGDLVRKVFGLGA